LAALNETNSGAAQTPVLSGTCDRLSSKLAQVMIQVLVHQDCPFLGSEMTEEGMGASRTDRLPAGHKSVNLAVKSLPLLNEVALVRDYEVRRSWRIPAYRLIIAKYKWLDEMPQDAPDEKSRWMTLAESPLHRSRAMCDRLGRVHLAPVPRTLSLKLCQSRFYFDGARRLIEILHTKVTFVGRTIVQSQLDR
jgi:hypothetical protein